MTPSPTRGISTIELMIAFAVLTLTLTAVVAVFYGNQSSYVDTQTETEALSRAQKLLAAERQASYQGITSKTGSETVGGLTYEEDLAVTDLTACKKVATSTVSWNTGSLRPQSVTLTTFFTDVAGALALGGDCATNPPTKRWNDPQRFASDTLNPGKSTAIDALNGIAYLGSDQKPYFAIADTSGATLGQTSGLFVSFDNGFNSDGKSIDQVNDVDAVKINGRTYAFVALASTTAQLGVIDVTDIHNPVLKATRQLSGVTGNTSTSWGWRVYYYDSRLYVTARETAGPELHVFDVSNPTAPVELGSKELNSTVNDFVVRDGIAYFAVDSNSRGEILAYNVSDPTSITEYVGARTDFPGSQDGESIALIGPKLYFGRQSVTTGPELYVLDASSVASLTSGFPTLGSAEIGGDVLALRITGDLCFLVSSKTNQEFQVWDIHTPSSVSLIARYNFGNIVAGGLDYEPDFIYATGNATPNFQILYSPT